MNININGSLVAGTHQGSVGYLCRDHNDAPILTRCSDLQKSKIVILVHGLCRLKDPAIVFLVQIVAYYHASIFDVLLSVGLI
jgi:hypothetical protein